MQIVTVRLLGFACERSTFWYLALLTEQLWEMGFRGNSSIGTSFDQTVTLIVRSEHPTFVIMFSS